MNSDPADWAPALTDAADRLRHSEHHTIQARQQLQTAVSQANRHGISQYQIAAITGYHRLTIRKWLGLVR